MFREFYNLGRKTIRISKHETKYAVKSTNSQE